MRVLVLVLSCARPPYDALCLAQLRTWDSIAVEGVSTRYYFSDGYEPMTGELRKALGAADGADFVFRTNSSSYVDKARLFEKARSLPSKRCYQGIDGGGFASGSGFFLSPDVIKVLQQDLPDRSSKMEDVVVGEVLSQAGISVLPGAERYDYWCQQNLLQFYRASRTESGKGTTVIRTAYHLRCKHSEDRSKDIEAMELIHRLKT